MAVVDHTEVAPFVVRSKALPVPPVSTVDGADGITAPIFLPPGTVAMGLPRYLYEQCSMMMCHGDAGLPYTRGFMTPEEERRFAAQALLTVGTLPLGWLNAARAAATPAVTEGTTLFRVFGGEARGLGQSWTTTNPAAVTNFRAAAGLFPGNTGQFVIEGRLLSTEGVLSRSALPGPGGIGGGLREVLVPNPASQIGVVRVSGANPGF